MKKEMESPNVNKTDELAVEVKELISAIFSFPLRGGKIDTY